MIPTHLAAYPWYAPHLAWLRSQDCVTAHDPGEAAPVHAYLRSANLHGAYLRSANLRGAYLHGAGLHGADLRSANLSSANLSSADLHGANLRSANLSSANLSSADLHGANLRSANLSSADLYGADLRSANLSSADLSSADLYGAIGISSAGPVGRERRIIYAVRHGDGVMVQAGCWWGTLADTEARIAEHYAGDPWLDPYLAAVRLAAACVMV